MAPRKTSPSHKHGSFDQAVREALAADPEDSSGWHSTLQDVLEALRDARWNALTEEGMTGGARWAEHQLDFGRYEPANGGAAENETSSRHVSEGAASNRP